MSALAILTKCPLAKCPLAKCPLVKCRLAKCPLAKCPDTVWIDSSKSDSCGVDSCGIDSCGIDSCGIDSCGINSCGSDSFGSDSCRLQVSVHNLSDKAITSEHIEGTTWLTYRRYIMYSRPAELKWEWLPAKRQLVLGEQHIGTPYLLQ